MEDTLKRELTLKFTSRDLAFYEKRTGKSLTDLIASLDEARISTIADAVSIGNHSCKIEDAYTRIDNFIEGGRTLTDLILQVIYEIDLDWGIVRSTGRSIEDIRAELNKTLKTETPGNGSPDVGEDTPVNNEELKVDINGTVN